MKIQKYGRDEKHSYNHDARKGIKNSRWSKYLEKNTIKTFYKKKGLWRWKDIDEKKDLRLKI